MAPLYDPILPRKESGYWEKKARGLQKVHWESLFHSGAFVRTTKKIECPIGFDLPKGAVLSIEGIEEGANDTFWIVCSSKKHGSWKVRPGDIQVIEEGKEQGAGRYRILLQNRACEEIENTNEGS